MSFSKHIIFSYTPSEILSQSQYNQNVMRVGGHIKYNSVVKISPNEHNFIIHDTKNELKVYFKGILPPLFKEGQESFITGYFNGKFFVADDVVAKHDEEYMPPQK